MKLRSIALTLAASVVVPIAPAQAQGSIGGQPKSPPVGGSTTSSPTSDSGTVTDAGATGSGARSPSDGFDRATGGATTSGSTLPVPVFQEGIIAFRVLDDDGTQHDMQYLTKGGKLRFEVSDPRGGSAVMIIDPATHQMLMLIPSEKMYMERSLAGGTPSKSVSTALTARPVFTGKKEMIAGYQCEHVTFTDDDGSKIDACIAKGLGTFMRPPAGNPMTGPPPKAANDWSTKLAAGWFPLKVTKGSNAIFQVTKIEKKPLDASLFIAPAGWQKLGGMPGMRPPGND